MGKYQSISHWESLSIIILTIIKLHLSVFVSTNAQTYENVFLSMVRISSSSSSSSSSASSSLPSTISYHHLDCHYGGRALQGPGHHRCLAPTTISTITSSSRLALWLKGLTVARHYKNLASTRTQTIQGRRPHKGADPTRSHTPIKGLAKIFGFWAVRPCGV